MTLFEKKEGSETVIRREAFLYYHPPKGELLAVSHSFILSFILCFTNADSLVITEIPSSGTGLGCAPQPADFVLAALRLGEYSMGCACCCVFCVLVLIVVACEQQTR